MGCAQALYTPDNNAWLIGISGGCKAVAEPCKAHKLLVFTLMVYDVISSH